MSAVLPAPPWPPSIGLIKLVKLNARLSQLRSRIYAAAMRLKMG
jgi:hypothetical protein